jgi:tRNA/tmRNA/rRNA uracil-C5-methylase (TrmA/RlmC/RlmD family)
VRTRKMVSRFGVQADPVSANPAWRLRARVQLRVSQPASKILTHSIGRCQHRRSAFDVPDVCLVPHSLRTRVRGTVVGKYTGLHVVTVYCFAHSRSQHVHSSN